MINTTTKGGKNDFKASERIFQIGNVLSRNEVK